MHWRDVWTRALWDDTALAAWHSLRAPALALAAVLAARVGGRRGWPLLAIGSAGLGLVVGWFVLFGLPPSAHALLAGPSLAERTRLLAVAALIAALLIGSASASETMVAALLAAGIGWWMAGAPATRGAMLRDAPPLLAAGGFAWLLLRLLRPPDGAGRALAAGAALAAGLFEAGAPPASLMLVLVPVACAAGLLGAPALPATLLPVAAGLATAGIAIVDRSGRMPHAGFGAVDAACLAPLFTLWVCGQLRRAPALLGNALGTAAGLGFAALLPRLIAWF